MIPRKMKSTMPARRIRIGSKPAKPRARVIGMGTKRKRTFRKHSNFPKDRKGITKEEIQRLRDTGITETEIERIIHEDYTTGMIDLDRQLRTRKKGNRL